MVTRDYQAKLWSKIWDSAIPTLDILTDNQLDLVFSIRQWMQEGEGYKLLPFIGGEFTIYALDETYKRFVYITLGQPKGAEGKAEEAFKCKACIEIAFFAEGQTANYAIRDAEGIVAGGIDLTVIKSYSCREVGNSEPTGTASKREHDAWEAKLAELKKPTTPTVPEYVNRGTVKLYDMTAEKTNSDWFENSIYDDANRLIIALEANPFYLNHLLHYVEPGTGKWEGEYKMLKEITEEERKRWYELTNTCDTHGHSGASFAGVIAYAMWRICGIKNVDGSLAEPMPDLTQLINYEQVLPGSLK